MVDGNLPLTLKPPGFPDADTTGVSSSSDRDPRRWHGKLDLRFTADLASPDTTPPTRLSRVQVQAPLKLQRPFYPEGKAVCHGVMLHTAGGVVGGDRLSVSIQVESQAQALLTTATAGKIYGSVQPCQLQGIRAQQEILIRLESGACLEWFPQETILFNGAVFQQTLHIDLAPDALWLGWEITRLGRTARGEQFLQGEWRSHTQVWQEGRPLWIDPQHLRASEALLQSPHGLAGCPVVGSFALVGRSPSADWIEAARTLGQAILPPAELGVTRLQSGMLCRYRGSSTSEVKRWFTAVWAMLRPFVLHRPACAPRVWQ